MKKRIYLNEFNVLMNNAVYLPLVSGLLQTNALSNEVIRDNYQFMPFLFIRKPIEEILHQYDKPYIAAFSVSMWNHNLSMAVAQKVKEKFPDCLIIMGGPNIPFQAKQFLCDNPFVDMTVRGEGEYVFNQILLRLLGSNTLEGIPSISYRHPQTKEYFENKEEPPLFKDLEVYPCPYLSGTFDSLFSLGYDFQAIVETNRGCPFQCSFCFWGQGIMKMGKKYRYFSLDRVKRIADWCGQHNIKYIFCADSNFGIFKRDVQVAQYFAETKKKFGFPDKFRVCYGKNAEDTVYQCGKILYDADMEKGITLSRQSNDSSTLTNIRRQNIKLPVYDNLAKKYELEGVPVYTEFILGLPGETYESFLNGLDQILECGVKTQIFVYLCQVLNNTELSLPEYRDKFQLKTVKIPLTEVHGSIRQNNEIMEYEEIVISTISLSVEQWKKSVVLSWVVQLFHSLKIGFFIMLYLHNYHHIKYMDFLDYICAVKMKTATKVVHKILNQFYSSVNELLNGVPYCRIIDGAYYIYWSQEEGAYLDVIDEKELFYSELLLIIKEYLTMKNIPFNNVQLEEVIKYQKELVPDYRNKEDTEISFVYNIPEYFICSNVELKESKQTILVKRPVYDSKEEFSKKGVLYGRKSNRMLYETELM